MQAKQEADDRHRVKGKRFVDADGSEDDRMRAPIVADVDIVIWKSDVARLWSWWRGADGSYGVSWSWPQGGKVMW